MSSTKSRVFASSSCQRCRACRPGVPRSSTWSTRSSMGRAQRQSPPCSAARRRGCRMRNSSGSPSLFAMPWRNPDDPGFSKIVVRTSFLAAAGLLASRMLRTRSAALRHATLAMTLAAAIAVVPLAMVLPRWNPLPLPVEGPRRADPIRLTLPAPAAPTATARQLDRPEGPHSASAVSIVGLVWTSGVAVFGLMLLAGLQRVRRLDTAAECVRSAEWTVLVDTIAHEYRLRRAVTISLSESPDLLATWRLVHPRVLLPSQAGNGASNVARSCFGTSSRTSSAVTGLCRLGAEVVRTLFWFNPLFWAICAQLRRESEQACDDLVLAGGIPHIGTRASCSNWHESAAHTGSPHKRSPVWHTLQHSRGDLPPC